MINSANDFIHILAMVKSDRNRFAIELLDYGVPIVGVNAPIIVIQRVAKYWAGYIHWFG